MSDKPTVKSRDRKLQQLHQPGTILNQRYRLSNVIGEGGIGITYAAQDLETNQPVALKTLSLERLTNWKVLELFEREARILATLNHPSIPDYIDYFHVDEPENKNFYLVQQLVTGESLAELVEKGWKATETEVKQLATQVLNILTYLHSLIPPVIHRDIKPQNIIRTKEGKIFLVDFGAVQDTYRHTVAKGSTVVGTFGYMAPEQFRGQATPATDFYGLATTLLFVLTGKSPADLPQQQLKINFRPTVPLSPNFANWLDRMLEPAKERRFPDTKAALAVLSGEKRLADYPLWQRKRPKQNSLKVTKTEEQLTIQIAPVWLKSNQALRLTFSTIVNGIFLIIMLLWFRNIWIQLSLEDVFYQDFSANSIYLMFFSILILLVIIASGWLEKHLLSSCLETMFPLHLEVNRNVFLLKREYFGSYPSWLKKRFRIKNFPKIELKNRAFRGRCINVYPDTKSKHFSFGAFIKESEQEWLVEEIETFFKRFI